MAHLPKDKPLLIRDEVHGDMTFDRVARAAIDHECFQRLRYIKQLGLAEYVFPCATHTRFQHSLGAAYLAGEYFDHLVASWMQFPFSYDGKLGGTRFFGRRTIQCVRSVEMHAPSMVFWRRVVTLAAMLHDVGHGPWSHSFENLSLAQDFSAITKTIPGAVGEYFKKLDRLAHEDISIVYIYRILSDLGFDAFFLPVASLVNKSLLGPELARELEAVLASSGVVGGLEFHCLLRPLVSGPFDVDRMDYIQRDGRNCGVFIGGIEWPRIVSKLLPCLAAHENDKGEPREVVLVSHLKNQHVLDDFIFSLFQMYAQVYMHPKIVGLEESIRLVLENHRASGESKLVIDFETHKRLSDERFRNILHEDFGITEIEALLFRRRGARFKIQSYPENSEVAPKLTEKKFGRLTTQERPMMKDSYGVFLYSCLKDSNEGPADEDYFVKPWIEASPIAQHFHSIHHAPQFWIRPGG